MGIGLKLKSLYEIYGVARDIFAGKFPAFVYGKGLVETEIVSFCLHGVTSDSFEQMLIYLKENDYHTLGINEFFRILTGQEKKRQERCILLTFDDGTGSMWSVAYPLLKKYGLRGTVFLVPGRISRRKQYLPNLEDVWAGRAKTEEIDNRDGSEEPFATWEEIQEMHESGCIDFESHSLDHSLVFVSPKIVDFVNPQALEQFHLFEFPRIRVDSETAEDINQLGMPLYSTRPRLSESLRYIDDASLRQCCVDYVQQQGGVAFFQQKDWRKKLVGVVKQHREKYGVEDEYETEEVRHEAIKFELHHAKELINLNLSGKETQHLCYPWSVGSQFAMATAKEVGYQTGFWDLPGCSKKIIVGQEPHEIARVGPDFFYVLPGNGSSNLGKVLVKKIRGRMGQPTPYLTH